MAVDPAAYQSGMYPTFESLMSAASDMMKMKATEQLGNLLVRLGIEVADSKQKIEILVAELAALQARVNQLTGDGITDMKG